MPSVFTVRVGDLHRLALVGRVVDVHRRRAVSYIAVVAPDQHFPAIDFEGVNAIDGIEIRAGC